jgi:hypothetical protein
MEDRSLRDDGRRLFLARKVIPEESKKSNHYYLLLIHLRNVLLSQSSLRGTSRGNLTNMNKIASYLAMTMKLRDLFN